MTEALPRVVSLPPSRDPAEREMFRNMTSHVLGLPTVMDWGYVPTLQSTIPYPPLPRIYRCERQGKDTPLEERIYHRWLECSCPKRLLDKDAD